VFYKLKVLFAAVQIYIAFTDTSTEGAVQQARTLVNEVEKQCKHKKEEQN
jgi:hypothetical protein